MTELCGPNREDACRWNAMAQQVVKFGTDLQNPCRRMLRHDLVRYLGDECFPIRRRDGSFVGDLLTFQVLALQQLVGR